MGPLPDPRDHIPAPKPGIGRIVHYRSRTGNYTVPAMVTCTVDTLAPIGVKVWTETEGKGGVPPLSSDTHVHLAVFTPGMPGMRAGAQDFVAESDHPRSENIGGTYQEWDIPMDDGTAEEQAAGTWRWPVIG